MPLKDKAAKAEYMRGYYQRNKKAQLDYRRKYRQSNQKALANYKADRGCADCGEEDSRVLQFHHTTDDKEFTIGARLGRKGLKSLLQEAAKCEIVCANCHIKRHSDIRAGY